jgi:hypothetical protein
MIGARAIANDGVPADAGTRLTATGPMGATLLQEAGTPAAGSSPERTDIGRCRSPDDRCLRVTGATSRERRRIVARRSRCHQLAPGFLLSGMATGLQELRWWAFTT